VSIDRSLGTSRALDVADRQCEDFGFPVNCEFDCSLSKSTRRERGDTDGSEV